MLSSVFFCPLLQAKCCYQTFMPQSLPLAVLANPGNSGWFSTQTVKCSADQRWMCYLWFSLQRTAATKLFQYPLCHSCHCWKINWDSSAGLPFVEKADLMGGVSFCMSDTQPCRRWLWSNFFDSYSFYLWCLIWNSNQINKVAKLKD